MELIDIAFFGCVFAALLVALMGGAQDLSVGMATSAGCGGLPIPAVLIAGAAIGGISALLIAPPLLGEIASTLLPATVFKGPGYDPARFGFAVFATLLTVAALAGLAVGVKLPTSLLVLFAGASIGVLAIVWDNWVAALWAGLGLLALAIGSALLAAAVGAACYYAHERLIHYAEQIRRRTRLVLPIIAGAIAFVALWLAAIAVETPLFAEEGAVRSAVVILLFSTPVVAFVVLMVVLYLRRNRVWPQDNHEGAEAAFSRLTVSSSLLITAASIAHQAMLVAMPLLAVSAMRSGGWEAVADGYPALSSSIAGSLWVIVPVAVGLAAGALLMGHQVLETLGSGITKFGPMQATSINFGTMSSLVILGAFGFPQTGAFTTLGAVGAVGAVRSPDRVKGLPIILSVLLLVVSAALAALLAAVLFGVIDLVLFSHQPI